MNPIVQQALGSLLRWVLALAAGYLVKAGVWSGSDAETYVAAGSLALLGLGWSLWQNYHGRLKLLTALEWAGASENEVKAHVAAGKPTPPVSTPPEAFPPGAGPVARD